MGTEGRHRSGGDHGTQYELERNGCGIAGRSLLMRGSVVDGSMSSAASEEAWLLAMARGRGYAGG
jgi:hypothetical protein